jgi:hypothetical protein
LTHGCAVSLIATRLRSTQFPLPAAAGPARGKQRTDLVPPLAYDLVADVDTALCQQVLDVAQDQRKADALITTDRITRGEELN